MSKFINYKNYLTELGYQMTSSKEEFKNNKISFICREGHMKDMSVNTFSNKKSKFKDQGVCSPCMVEKNNKDRIKKMEEASGHTILSLKNRQVVFICGNCGEEGKTHESNIARGTTGSCKKCMNDVNKLTYDDVKSVIDERGFIMTWEEKDFAVEYENKETPIPFICSCGNEGECRIADLRAGYHCGICKLENTKKTNKEKYGHENTFQVEKFKQKARETCKKNHGVEHAQQSAEVREKTTATSLERYGKVRAFCQDEVYEKIRATCLEKYGSEYFLHSDVFFEKMIDKYGVKHRLQDPETFEKWLTTRYKRKEYTFKNGRTVSVLGYENMCLEELEDRHEFDEIYAGGDSEIPIVWYMLDGVKRRYYPDIYIPSINTIVEVKSKYTFESDLEKNLAKANQCSKDYNFVFWMYDEKKDTPRIFTYYEETNFIIQDDYFIEDLEKKMKKENELSESGITILS